MSGIGDEPAGTAGVGQFGESVSRDRSADSTSGAVEGILDWVPEAKVCRDGLTLKNCISPRCKPGATAGTQSWRSSSMNWMVTGRPFGYSSTGEQQWKDMLTAAVPPSQLQHSGSGLLTDFSVPLPTRQAPGFDLDNLLDLAFSAVVNRRGWFGGRRPNLRWIAAQKEVRAEPGVRLAVLDEPPSLWRPEDVDVVLDAVYQADIPNAAAMGNYEEWVRRNTLRSLPPGGVGIAIDLADERVNLGDVGTGAVKALINGLWPVLGGERGAPYDGRIAALVVRKGVSSLAGTVAVKVVGLGRDDGNRR